MTSQLHFPLAWGSCELLILLGRQAMEGTLALSNSTGVSEDMEQGERAQGSIRSEVGAERLQVLSSPYGTRRGRLQRQEL